MPEEWQESLRKWILDDILLKQYQVPQDKIVLQFAETCLRNCYGLDVLHHFVYKVYLQRKRTELELKLNQVLARMEEAENFQPTSMDYGNFVQKLESETNPPPSKQKKKTVTFEETPKQVESSPTEQVPSLPST